MDDLFLKYQLLNKLLNLLQYYADEIIKLTQTQDGVDMHQYISKGEVMC